MTKPAIALLAALVLPASSAAVAKSPKPPAPTARLVNDSGINYVVLKVSKPKGVTAMCVPSCQDYVAGVGVKLKGSETGVPGGARRGSVLAVTVFGGAYRSRGTSYAVKVK